jgi:glycosyltransferase involved in cell wall biosynthesis
MFLIKRYTTCMQKLCADSSEGSRVALMTESPPLLSVVVPVYNVAPYLRRCLDSICNQTYSHLEIILIDDGSTDGSGVICEEYATKDSRIYAIHKENGGLSSARNRGLEKATGAVIGFVDSDDWIDPSMYERLMDKMAETGADLVECGIVTGDGTIYYQPSASTQNTLEALGSYFETKQPRNHVWTKIFKAELIGGLRFDEGFVYEDAYFTCSALSRAQSVAFVDACLYIYVMNTESITRSEIDEHKITSRILMLRRVEEVACAFDQSLLPGLHCWVFRNDWPFFLRLVLDRKDRLYPQLFQEYRALFLKHYPGAKKSAFFLQLPFRRKMKIALALRAPGLLRLIEGMRGRMPQSADQCGQRGQRGPRA